MTERLFADAARDMRAFLADAEAFRDDLLRISSYTPAELRWN